MTNEYRPGYPIDLRAPAMAARAAAGPYGDFEARAARVVARATGLKTVIQDDNRSPRAADLRIERAGQVVGCVEIVTTTQGPRAEQLRAFIAGHLEFDSNKLTGTWWVTVTPAARRERLREVLVDTFTKLEKRGAYHQLRGLPAQSEQVLELAELERLGLTEVVCDPTPRVGFGKIYGQPQGFGGPVEIDWIECAQWIDEFLGSELCRRKLSKLTSAAESHLYVGTTGHEPWAIHQVLKSGVVEVRLPTPNLPRNLSHFWLDDAEFPGRVIAWWPSRGWFDVRTRWASE